MLDLLVFGIGVVAAPGLRLVLVRLHRGRWSEPPMPNQYLPPPTGHRAVITSGERALTCPCGWQYAVARPTTSRRVNRARLDHYSAVEQQRIAQRLGVDTESVLDRVATARGGAEQSQDAARREPGVTAPQIGARSERPRRLEPARSTRRAAQARRASAIARVEAARVLPEYTGGDE